MPSWEDRSPPTSVVDKIHDQVMGLKDLSVKRETPLGVEMLGNEHFVDGHYVRLRYVAYGNVQDGEFCKITHHRPDRTRVEYVIGSDGSLTSFDPMTGEWPEVEDPDHQLELLDLTEQLSKETQTVTPDTVASLMDTIGRLVSSEEAVSLNSSETEKTQYRISDNPDDPFSLILAVADDHILGETSYRVLTLSAQSGIVNSLSMELMSEIDEVAIYHQIRMVDEERVARPRFVKDIYVKRILEMIENSSPTDSRETDSAF